MGVVDFGCGIGGDVFVFVGVGLDVFVVDVDEVIFVIVVYNFVFFGVVVQVCYVIVEEVFFEVEVLGVCVIWMDLVWCMFGYSEI